MSDRYQQLEVFKMVIFEVASCERCDPLQKSGLLTRVPTSDLVRPSRIALSCRCGARYVRPNGE